MSDRRTVRQWLDTDAALGAAEVPVPRRRATEMPRVAAPVAVRAAVRAPVPPPVRPVPAAPRMSDYAEEESAMARAVKTALPAAPAGDISDLPKLTHEQKAAALEQLQKECLREAKPFINEVATRLVFGEGDMDAEIMFIGEGPGAEEDRTGRPFVGKSGQLLDKMIVAMGLTRQAVYIANVVKLRAAEMDETTGRLKDRAPNPEEVARGIPFLHRQIEIIRPRVIVTLGGPSLKYVTNEKEGVMKVRGHWRSYRGIAVMPTYHPSFVLRAYTPENRGKVWGDLQLVMKYLKEN